MRFARDAAVVLLALPVVMSAAMRPGSEKASPPRKRDRTPDDQTPVVPRVCQDGQTQPDNR
jgi:hypothetical protein